MPTPRKKTASQPIAVTLYKHKPRPHTVQDAHQRHQTERVVQPGVAGLNQRLAVILTTYVGTMFTAYGFAALAIVGLFGVLAILSPSTYTLVAWLSQTFIQLVLLPVIMVGQNVLNRHAELQSMEQYHAVMNTQHDAEQIAIHLSRQDDLILQILHSLTQVPSPPDSPDDDTGITQALNSHHHPTLTAMTQPMKARRP